MADAHIENQQYKTFVIKLLSCHNHWQMAKLSQYFDLSPRKKFNACTSAGRAKIYGSSTLAAQNLYVILISGAHFTNFPVWPSNDQAFVQTVLKFRAYSWIPGSLIQSFNPDIVVKLWCCLEMYNCGSIKRTSLAFINTLLSKSQRETPEHVTSYIPQLITRWRMNVADCGCCAAK